MTQPHGDLKAPTYKRYRAKIEATVIIQKVADQRSAEVVAGGLAYNFSPLPIESFDFTLEEIEEVEGA